MAEFAKFIIPERRYSLHRVYGSSAAISCFQVVGFLQREPHTHYGGPPAILGTVLTAFELQVSDSCTVPSQLKLIERNNRSTYF